MALKKGTLLEDVQHTLDKDTQDLSEFHIFVLCVGHAEVKLSMSDVVDRYNKIVKKIFRQNEVALVLYGSVLPLGRNLDFQRLVHAKNSRLQAEYMLKDNFSYFSINTKMSNKGKLMPELISGAQLSNVDMMVFAGELGEKLSNLHTIFKDTMKFNYKWLSGVLTTVFSTTLFSRIYKYVGSN